MSIKVTRKNEGGLSELQKRYAEANNKSIAIGWPTGGDDTGLKYPDGTPVLLVAFWQQFGTKTIPRRNFMDPGFDRALEATAELREDLFEAIISGGDTKSIMDQIGLVSVGEHQGAITDLDNPPLAESTIERKGSENPLIDTGLMRQSITYVVRDK